MSGKLRAAYFSSLLLLALAMAPAMAHLLALPNKIGMSSEAYFTAQQIYRGWALLGIVIFGALLSTLILTVFLYGHTQAFLFSLVTVLCISASLAVFFAFTFPANQATNNWTVIPDNWLQLRRQWEYSHATGAILYLIGLITLILSALSQRLERSDDSRRS